MINMKNKIIISIVVLSLIFTTRSYSLEALMQKSHCDFDCCRSLNDRPPMTYTYYQKTGRFVGGTGDFHIDTLGYSGQK